MKESPSIGSLLKMLADGGYIKQLSILMIIGAISTLHLNAVAFAMEI
jgi:hypothetical protein